jgi:UDP-glucose 4-epimerase
MQTVRGEREAISIYGNDYDTKDGTCVRDYIHVNDLSRVHLQGVEYLLDGAKESKVYNLGNGEGFSVKEIIEKVKEITNKEFKVLEEGRRAGDPATLIASSQRAKEELGFAPQIDKVDDIIKTLV